jgi:hypothetical protein
MENTRQASTFFDQVDSLQRRFVKSLIAGRRDPIFQEPMPMSMPEGQPTADSQRAEGARTQPDRIQRSCTGPGLSEDG